MIVYKWDNSFIANILTLYTIWLHWKFVQQKECMFTDLIIITEIC